MRPCPPELGPVSTAPIRRHASGLVVSPGAPKKARPSAESLLVVDLVADGDDCAASTKFTSVEVYDTAIHCPAARTWFLRNSFESHMTSTEPTGNERNQLEQCTNNWRTPDRVARHPRGD